MLIILDLLSPMNFNENRLITIFSQDPYIDDHFDLNIGYKYETKSYKKIIDLIQ